MGNLLIAIGVFQALQRIGPPEALTTGRADWNVLEELICAARRRL
jgi:hypothetical protein